MNEERLEEDDDEIKELKDILASSLSILIDSNDELLQITRDTYITIPQYESICWFISILTGMTYSDKSKKLLIQKQEENKERILDLSKITTSKTRRSSKTLFVSFVYYIINNITKGFKKYGKLRDDCEIFKYLKEIPIYFINYLVEEYRTKYQSTIDEANLKEENKKNPLKLENTLYGLLRENNTNPLNYVYELILDKNSIRIKQIYFSIIKYFYNFLQINCGYIYKINDKYYKINDGEVIDYDVIIIDYTTIINDNEKIRENVKRNTKELSDDIIKYLPNKNIVYNKKNMNWIIYYM